MSANRRHLAIGCGIVLLSVFESIQAYPNLPDPMASTFGGDGTPGGWSTKQSFIFIHAVSMLFWLGALVAAPFLAARARQNFTPQMREWLRKTVGWFLIASLTLSALITHWVFEANLETGRLSAAFGWLLAVYMAYMVWWTVRLVGRIRRAERRE
ncbi:MAG: hypothetical protein BMS9Abin37_0561 [Acidobacteriota bacterium]|nr:MAG: hypothetical protein BMS9Abin37_0561 [Acidobacteriota bacterium]